MIRNNELKFYIVYITIDIMHDVVVLLLASNFRSIYKNKSLTMVEGQNLNYVNICKYTCQCWRHSFFSIYNDFADVMYL